jgi:hypothetical protein
VKSQAAIGAPVQQTFVSYTASLTTTNAACQSRRQNDELHELDDMRRQTYGSLARVSATA